MKSLIIVLFVLTVFISGCSAPWRPYPYFNPQNNSEPKPKEELTAPMDLQLDEQSDLHSDAQIIEPNPDQKK